MTMLDDHRTPVTPEGQPTLGRAHLEAELDVLGDTYLPPAALRASILGRVQAQATPPRSIGSPSRQPRPIVRPRRGLLLVAAALATAALLDSAAATGIISLPDRALDPYPDWYQTGIGQIVEQHLGVHLNLSQRICGFTMTIDRAYADRHIAVVAYTLRGPAGRRWGETGFFADVSLRDAQGHTFPFAGGRSTAPPYTLGNGNYTAFELSRAPGPPRTLALRLTVASIQGGEVLGAGRKASVTCEVYGKTFPRGTGSKQSGPTRLVRAWGPRTFAFALPADARMRTLAPRKRVLAGGTAITLTRVEVTPIDVRMYLHGAKGGDFYGQLSIGNRHGRKTTAWEGYSTRRNAVLSADAPLYGYHGPATLTTRANRWASGRPTLPGGPGTFHFIIPCGVARRRATPHGAATREADCLCCGHHSRNAGTAALRRAESCPPAASDRLHTPVVGNTLFCRGSVLTLRGAMVLMRSSTRSGKYARRCSECRTGKNHRSRDCMDTPHHSMLIHWSDEDQSYLVTLPGWGEHMLGPVTHGSTYEEAVARGKDALEALIASAHKHNEPLPPLQPPAAIDQTS